MHTWRVAAIIALVGATASRLVACASFSSDAAPVDTGDAAGDAGLGPDVEPPPPCDMTKREVDPFHCGRCGHSCFGGKCVGAECQPAIVGKSTGEAVVAVAVDASRVLWLTSLGAWSNSGHLYACPKSGCAPAPVALVSPPIAPGNLVARDELAFFSVLYGGDPHISEIKSDGTLPRIPGGSHTVVRLQLVGKALYYMSLYESGAKAYNGKVFRWDGTKETLVAGFESDTNTDRFAIAGGRAFFGQNYAILQCTLEACDAVQTFATPSEMTVMIADGASILWGNTNGTVVTCPAAGPCTTPTPVLEKSHLGEATPLELAVFGKTLYVATSANDIFACDLPGCAASVRKIVHENRLFQGNEYFFGAPLAVDQDALYWAAIDGTGTISEAGEDVTGLSHRIMKLAK